MRSGDVVEVTNVELFFDLVYVFAITQLSHRLATHTSVESAVQTAILLGLVWQAWAYTTWVTNWVDPDRLPTRAMLLAVMLASLVLSAGLPRAFADRGLVVAGAYAAIQIGRSVFAVFAVRGHRLQRNFERILAWCVISGVALIVGSRMHGHAREAIWLAAVAFDFLGGRVGFWTPVLGRSTTDEWTISGNHFAERCEAFVIIALGESVVAIGTTLSSTARLTAAQVVTFVVAFAGTVGLWWVYFDRVAESGARRHHPRRRSRPARVARLSPGAPGDHRRDHRRSSRRQPDARASGPTRALAGHVAAGRRVRAVPGWPRPLQSDRVPRHALVANRRHSRAGAAGRRLAVPDGACARHRHRARGGRGGGGGPVTAPGAGPGRWPPSDGP